MYMDTISFYMTGATILKVIFAASTPFPYIYANLRFNYRASRPHFLLIDLQNKFKYSAVYYSTICRIHNQMCCVDFI